MLVNLLLDNLHTSPYAVRYEQHSGLFSGNRALYILVLNYVVFFHDNLYTIYALFTVKTVAFNSAFYFMLQTAKEEARSRAAEESNANDKKLPNLVNKPNDKFKAASMDHLHKLSKTHSVDSDAESMPDIKGSIQPFQRSQSLKEGNINLPDNCMHAFR